MTRTFPPQQPGLFYLTEGGQETEILYKYGFDLPEFSYARSGSSATFPRLTSINSLRW